jgi:hypothetical protein
VDASADLTPTNPERPESDFFIRWFMAGAISNLHPDPLAVKHARAARSTERRSNDKSKPKEGSRSRWYASACQREPICCRPRTG